MTESAAIAGRGRRLIATVIDMLLVPALTIVLVMAFDVVEDAEDYRGIAWLGWVFALAVVSYLVLNGYLLWRHGQTIGKTLLGINIVSANDGTRAPLWKLVCVRALFFPLLYLIAAWPWLLLPVADQALIFGKRRRCLHDLAAGTVVVRRAAAQ